MLLDDFELWLERGEHVSLIGPNGAGKTTLIHTLTGERELAAGKLRRGHNVKVGLLSQHAEELGAKGARTVLEAAQRSTGLKPNEARSLLGRFLFSGEAAEKPLDGLSGGERRRLSLAILVHSGANVLVLDEPTNHLDLESREALEEALQAFPGSLLLISHDRALLDAVGTPHGRGRGRHAALLRRRLARVRARARGARGGRADGQARQAGQAAARQGAAQARRAVEEPAAAGQEARGRDRGGRGRRCARSRRSSPTPPPGTTPAPRRSRPSATSRPSAQLQDLYAEWEAVAG